MQKKLDEHINYHERMMKDGIYRISIFNHSKARPTTDTYSDGLEWVRQSA